MIWIHCPNLKKIGDLPAPNIWRIGVDWPSTRSKPNKKKKKPETTEVEKVCQSDHLGYI
jgi:hypothetical protein